ncbi:MAG TPA: hypothetical protein VGF46_05970 [Gaiellales bacterium]
MSDERTTDRHFDEYDAIPSRLLHDRAVELAQERHDVAFFWKLLKAIPEAESVAGKPDETTADLLHISRWVADFIDSRDLDDALRPLYVQYLIEHAS